MKKKFIPLFIASTFFATSGIALAANASVSATQFNKSGYAVKHMPLASAAKPCSYDGFSTIENGQKANYWAGENNDATYCQMKYDYQLPQGNASCYVALHFDANGKLDSTTAENTSITNQCTVDNSGNIIFN